MRVLITGGSGFIGRYCCEYLRARGHSLTILDLVTPPWDAREARVVQGDIRDIASVRSALEQCDAVLHLAAAHADFGISREIYDSVNERGSALLCEAMDACNVRDVCFLSSVAVYGDAPEPHDENAATHPTTPYGQSKLAAERVFRRWTEQGGGRTALVIRPTAVFGPRNFANMFRLIRQIHSRLYLPIGRGANVKSLAYVENLVAATYLLWRRTGRPAFDLFNYADKPDLTSREIAATVSRALGRRPLSLTLPLPIARLLTWPFDWAIALTGKDLPISTARLLKMASAETRFEAHKARAAGVRPAITLTDGITRMVEWYLREGYARRAYSPPELGRAGASSSAARAAGRA